jgi:DNA-binding NarL/FixJ family response regulator
MNLQNNPTLIAVSLLNLITCAITLALFLKLRRKLNGISKNTEQELSQLSADLDTASNRAAAFERRLTPLELIAKAKRNSEQTDVVAEGKKLSITERRHRVIALWRRGQNVQSIARTLNMPDGEVELMISITRAA